MKNKLAFWISFLLLSATLAGCSRGLNRNQGAQNPADAGSPPVAATLAPAPIQALPPAPPADTQMPQPASNPTQAPAEATAVQPAADSSAINQAADDLSKALDGLTKDLDSTDTLNDVK